ncbi:MAG: aminotransferase class I/II-fold pyridoxal phosphate-dependent enzyme [Chloroflexota bacterium]|nr:aminotransferase class I/II-fold pyridoxal phosphate-dependent enzyme [Chloroflexota bacterium]
MRPFGGLTMAGFATRAIRAAADATPPRNRPVNVPIYQTSTFEFETAADLADVLEFRVPGHSYTRYSNPTHAAFEATMADLEGGEAALATASGMAAIHAAILSLVREGDEILAPRSLYGGTLALLRRVLDRYGVGHRFERATDLGAYEAAIGPRTRLMWAETIANPTVDVSDIAALAEIAHRHGIPLVVDNTFASPYLCNPLALGGDLVVHSVTKYIGGHADLTAGVVVGSAERIAAAREVVINTGGNAQPLEAFLAMRGLKTLSLRMERHSVNALAVAAALEQRPGVTRVLYPGLPSHPTHDVACRQLRDGMAGGMMSIELAGGRAAGEAFLERLRVAVHATSLGGVETLCSHPASSSHRQLDERELAEAGLTPGLVRISIGLEDADDLIADLSEAASG